jgi:hypothetical protein
MNLNNLENLRGEMRGLRFSEKLVGEMEKKMQENLPEFQLRTQVPGNKGQVDFVLHFKQSNQSEHYFLNRYHVTLDRSKPLEEGHKYLVINESEKGKPLFRKFDGPYQAIDYFREQKGNAELAAGKDISHKTVLATMEQGKINYVARDFSKTFYAPPVEQVFYLDKGKGFTAEQAANLIEGRSVYRDDLLNLGGVPYKAWMKMDFDHAKDRNQNYTFNQYHDPSYGFNLEKTLERYDLKELGELGKREELMESLRNGNRPVITAVKDGEEVRLHIEAVPRYSQVNFYQQNGKPEKREQFEKAAEKEQLLDLGKGKAAAKELEAGQAMGL